MYCAEYSKVDPPALVSKDGRELKLEDVKLEFLQKGVELIEPLQLGRMEVIVR